MPIYEYECTACGDRFDRRQSFTDEPVKTCPVCGGGTRKVLQPVGIVFKGSGWYKTDSRGPAPVESSSPSSPSTPATDSKAPESVTKTDSPSAPKAEPTKTAVPAAAVK